MDSAVKACAPAAPGTTTTTAPTTTTTAAAGGRRKRSFGVVEVTVVSHENFNPQLNPAYMAALKSAVREHAKRLGLMVPYQMTEEVRNVSGKFAAHYKIWGARCEQVRAFMEGLRARTNTKVVIRLQCENGEQFLIN
ncbi:unnamed protein product [Nippostrongylus brasiliensis]|uniref:Ykof domain-containing protein n=1 Tax=Nippostrongylus brasiliensis TaxID=27835 RepID=A0A0N4YKF8_NIPBR|nr:unnamed protein product [Nippostrongylus brasiliensis]